VLAQDNTLTEARALLSQGNAKDAIAKLQTLPSDARAQQLLGVAYFRTNEYVKAIATLTPIYHGLAERFR
jgi:cytochrome c-type biogenesis protein CcmH/NrfG